jgi:hypothetical protein
MVDDDVYVVVECSSAWIDLYKLDHSIVTPFQIDTQPELRILPLSAIARPLAVVVNYKAPNKTHYLACLPERKWPNIFRNRIHALYELSQNKDNASQPPPHAGDQNGKIWEEYHLYTDEIEEDSDSEGETEEDEDDTVYSDENGSEDEIQDQGHVV